MGCINQQKCSAPPAMGPRRKNYLSWWASSELLLLCAYSNKTRRCLKIEFHVCVSSPVHSPSPIRSSSCDNKQTTGPIQNPKLGLIGLDSSPSPRIRQELTLPLSFYPFRAFQSHSTHNPSQFMFKWLAHFRNSILLNSLLHFLTIGEEMIYSISFE